MISTLPVRVLTVFADWPSGHSGMPGSELIEMKTD